MKRFACLALAVSAVMVLGIGTVAAQTHPAYMYEAQGFAGSYGMGPDEFDDHVVWGGSFGWKMNPALVFESGLSTTSFDGDFEDNREKVSFDGDAVFFDAGVEWVWWPQHMISPTLVGGLGWAFMSVDASSDAPRVSVDVNDLTDDSLTLYGGVGLKVRLGQDNRFFLNGRWFYRWFDQRSSDSADRELTVALGWEF